MDGLAERLRTAREDRNLTQAVWAEKIGVPYRTLQDNERGHSTPGSAVLIAYANQGVDMNWLLTGKSATPPKPRKRKQVPIKGKRFRVRGRRSVSIPHYDPFDPDSFDPNNPDSVITLDPSRLTAFNPDYAIRQLEWAELATTNVIDDGGVPNLRIGTLVLFDTSLRSDNVFKHRVVRRAGQLEVTEHVGIHDPGIVGQVIFMLSKV
jgi:DNA-binding XRE family transcriptional regulator